MTGASSSAKAQVAQLARGVRCDQTPPALKRPWILPLALALACRPDIAQDEEGPATVTARFDPGGSPPVVPTPNDLAKNRETGKLVVASAESASAAQRAFNEDYLGGLDGFPFESTAEVLFTGRLDARTVSGDSVIVLDLTDGSAPVTVTPRYDDEKRAIAIPPPAGGWLRAHRYVAAVIGGASKGGVRGVRGQDVIGTAAWVLVTGQIPLFECEKTAPDECRPTVDIIPSDKFDPVEKFQDQLTKAKRLEQLRKNYAPLIDAVAKAKKVTKADVPILWTFTAVDAAEVTFDPGNRVIPYIYPLGRVKLAKIEAGGIVRQRR